MTPDIDPDDFAQIEAHTRALYELRLKELPVDDTPAVSGLRWACAAYSEAMNMLEILFGQERARDMVEGWLDARERYTGPRLRRMRH